MWTFEFGFEIIISFGHSFRKNLINGGEVNPSFIKPCREVLRNIAKMNEPIMIKRLKKKNCKLDLFVIHVTIGRWIVGLRKVFFCIDGLIPI